MRTTTAHALPLALLILASLACSTLLGGAPPTHTPQAEATPTPRPTRTSEPEPTESTADVLLDDDFRSKGWGTTTGENSSIEYANDTLQFIVFTTNWFTWSTPNDETYEDVHIEVTAINNGSDPTTALGVMCNQQGDSASFYYFAITPAGQYAIALAATGEEDLFITNDNEWASSDLIAQNADSYRIGADCGRGRLTLYVDGAEVDSVSDDTYTSGGVGLIVWSGEEATETDIAFDDYLLTELP